VYSDGTVAQQMKDMFMPKRLDDMYNRFSDAAYEAGAVDRKTFGGAIGHDHLDRGGFLQAHWCHWPTPAAKESKG
jgi:hypothetical protein